MKLISNRRSGFLSDAKKVWPWYMLSETAGTYLMWYSRWVAVVTTGVSAVGAGAKGAGYEHGLSLEQALSLPVIITGACLALGAALKYLPQLLYVQKASLATANDLNLMEDYRKARKQHHLERLWEKVWQHEPFEEYPDKHPEATSLGPVIQASQHGKAAQKKAFLSLAREALETAQPQSAQRASTGLRFAILENWYDAGYFDIKETKLLQDYEGRESIVRIRELVPFSTLDRIRELIKTMEHRIWTGFIMQAVAIDLGTTVKNLNTRFDTDLFSSQTLLWPGEEDAGWLKRFPGAREAVLEARLRVLHNRLGPDLETAERKIHRMFTAPFELVTTLRARFDVEYLLGEVGGSVLDDLELHQFPAVYLYHGRRYRLQTERELERFQAFLEAARPELFQNGQNEERRAVRLGFHANYRGLKDRFFQALGRTADYSRIPVHETLDEIIHRRDAWTRRLVDLRVLHELTRIHIDEYKHLIYELAYRYDGPQAAAPADRDTDH